MPRGGKRKGAGRKPVGTKRVWYWIKPETEQAIIKKAKAANFEKPGQYLDSVFN